MTTGLTLEQAQHAYGRSLVPWVLDEDDLKVVNKARREATAQTGSCMRIPDPFNMFNTRDLSEVIGERLWVAAKKYE
jgi:hypothetical protein